MDNLEKKISLISIQNNISILEALKLMDKTGNKLLLVFEDKRFIGLLSIGDIQRSIIRNTPICSKVQEILRVKVRVAREGQPFNDIRQIMLENRTECMPIVNDSGDLIDVYFWEDVFGKETERIESKINLPIVIMAGGRGTRLKPLTNIIPKALIPIGEKTILEKIMDHFLKVGCKHFFISLNYKADMIKYYFDNLNTKKYQISYLREDKALGTAGSLHLLKGKIDTTFFVSNCDIIIDTDYREILKYHLEKKNELTIVSALKHYHIPYGIIEIEDGGVLTKFTEKPELTFQINSGMYILEPHLLNEINNNVFFHITDLIKNIVERNGRVGVFPVSERSWIDIGTKKEYLNFINF